MESSFYSNWSPTYNSDLLSPGLWDTLTIFVTVYRKISILPFSFSTSFKKLHILNMSNCKRFLMKFNTVMLIGHTFFCFLLLAEKLLSPTKTDMGNILNLRTCIIFYFAILAPSLIPINIYISFKPELVCDIVNAIMQLQFSISGNKLLIIINDNKSLIIYVY